MLTRTSVGGPDGQQTVTSLGAEATDAPSRSTLPAHHQGDAAPTPASVLDGLRLSNRLEAYRLGASTRQEAA